MGTYTFTHIKDGILGKTDENLQPVGESFELLNQIPRTLPFAHGSHKGDKYFEHATEVSVGEPGYGPALQDWLFGQRVKLDYEG